MGVKYSVNETFFDKWKPEMAYVLGYLYADGSMEDASYLRGKYVRVTSVDRDTIANIRKWLESKHTIVKLKPSCFKGKERYLLRIGSHKLYDSLSVHGLYPNKSLTITMPVIPKDYLCDFVRGYFDGDGCVVFERSKGKTKELITKRLRIIFTSGSKTFLQELASTLEGECGLRNGKIYNSSRAFQLRYPTSDSIELFKFFYKGMAAKLCLRRKFEIFREYFKIQSQRVDGEIVSILRRA